MELDLGMRVKAVALLKHNIDALLKARGQTRRDLARWCRRSEGWLSQIFSDDERNLPLKYLDRIADFFGLVTYQLFQPGISPLTERRVMTRRSGRDRRISAAVFSEKPGDVDAIHLIRALSPQGREQAIRLLADILNSELPRRPTTSGGPDEPDRSGGTAKGAGARARRSSKPET